jgi:hypothetical protein
MVRVRVLAVLAVAAAMMIAVVAHGAANAAVQYALGIGAISADGDPMQGNEFGKCTDTFVDLSCAGSALVVGLDAGHIGYAGRMTPGTIITVSYRVAGSLGTRHVDTMTADPSGAVAGPRTDVRSFMSPGETLRMRVQWTNGVVTTNPTAVEYAVML